MEEEKHIPGEQAADNPPTPEPKPEGDAPAPEGNKPEGDKPKTGEEGDKRSEGDKPKDEKPADTPAPPLPKKRSIYDDLKITRKEKGAFKDAAIAALEARGVKLTGNETAEDLLALAKATPSPAADKSQEDKPKDEKPAPTDDLAAYAEEHGLDAKELGRLAEIITKRIPQAQLSDEEKADLAALRTWRTDQGRQGEDQEILSQSSQVKADLGITDDAELQNVMKEIVKLAHTERFHDKEVGYIVWANKDALSKLISPKKPSFESGGQRGEAAAVEELDLSSGKVTPAQVEKEVQGRGRTGSNEIRRTQ